MTAAPANGAARTVVFALLVLATLAAFFVTQRLKTGQPVVKRLALQRYFSPNGDHRKDRASVAFDLPKGDRVTVDVVTRDGERVRRLVDDRELSRGHHEVTWNGHADDGTVPADGTYFVRVTLRRQGRAATGVRGIQLITAVPRPRIVSVTPSRVSSHAPRPIAIRFSGPSVVRPLFGIWRTDRRPAVRVATLTALRGQHSVTWDGRIGTRPAAPGNYAVSVTVQNRALVEGSSPRRLPPTRAGALPGTGFSISGTTASGPLEPVLAGGVVRIGVQNGAHRFRWSVRRVGAKRPLRRGRGAGGTLPFRMPPSAATGEYVVAIAAGGRPALVPLTVRGRRRGRVLVVVPSMAWQGGNQVDDDADGFPDTLYDARTVALARPFAAGRAPGSFSGQVAPLLRFLDANNLSYDVTTDLALARGHAPPLTGRPGVVLAGDEPWLPPVLATRLRAYVTGGGRLASFGWDSLRRRVSVTPTALTAPTPPARANALGEATAPEQVAPAALAASTDDLGLFAGTGGVVGPFTRFDQSRALPRGARALTAAGRDPQHTALIAYRLGRGTVLRLGTPQWSRSLDTVPEAAQVTRTTWAFLSR
ncbi:MAG: hypothetical protein QOD53_1046 [Thermoleophilaceae bacterium]|nr:hypothetical protein [Thermoleophilaceae bacterium]